MEIEPESEISSHLTLGVKFAVKPSSDFPTPADILAAALTWSIPTYRLHLREVAVKTQKTV